MHVPRCADLVLRGSPAGVREQHIRDDGRHYRDHLWQCLHAPPVAPTIRGNLFQGSGQGKAIYIYYNSSPDLLIEGNTITNWAYGIHNLSSCMVARSNEITGCQAWGIYCQSFQPGSSLGGSLAYANDIHDNGGHNLQVTGGVVLPASHNYWGTVDETELLQTISGPASYSPWTDAAHQQAYSTDDLVGVLGSDRILSGVVTVRGDVFVPQGVTLTLTSGTTLEFWANAACWDTTLTTGSNGLCDLWVLGTLKVEGAPGDSVVFLADSHIPGAYQWGAICLGLGADTSAFTCAVIRDATTGLEAGASGLRMDQSRFSRCGTGCRATGCPSLSLQRCRMSQISSIPIYLEDVSNIDIGSCTIQSIAYGVYARRVGGSISHCTFSAGSSSGVCIENTSAPLTMSDLTIASPAAINGIDVQHADHGVTIRDIDIDAPGGVGIKVSTASDSVVLDTLSVQMGSGTGVSAYGTAGGLSISHASIAATAVGIDLNYCNATVQDISLESGAPTRVGTGIRCINSTHRGRLDIRLRLMSEHLPSRLGSMVWEPLRRLHRPR
jgi:hypothetical protein